MADMELVINISEDVYTRLFDNGIQDNEISVDDVCEMARAIRLGTPLDKIRAEIKKAVWEDVVVSLDGTDEVRIPRLDPDDVFKIIDKYKGESEESDADSD